MNFTTEVFGDAWSLLILRDIAGIGKKTFGELLASDERIGRSVLADRLAHLESRDIITKHVAEHDKRITHYSLTETGLKVLPLLYEVGAWGSEISPNPSASKEWFASLKLDRPTVLQAWENAVRSGSSFQNGPDSAIKQLGLA